MVSGAPGGEYDLDCLVNVLTAYNWRVCFYGNVACDDVTDETHVANGSQLKAIRLVRAQVETTQLGKCFVQ